MTMELAGLMVEQAFTDCLPRDAPLPFKIIEAHFTKRIKKKSIAQAVVEMFDGEQAIVEVTAKTEIGWSWQIRWIKLDSDISYENDKWIRAAIA